MNNLQKKFLVLIILLTYIFNANLFAQDPRTPSAILQRIDSLVESDVRQWCESVDISYPPEASLLRIFKREKKLRSGLKIQI